MAQVTARRALASAIAGVLMVAMPTAPVLAQDAVGYQPALDAGWAGHYDEALRLIDAYLATHPDDHAARLDRARFLAWRGDYAAAMTAIDSLPADDADAVALRARTLAWAGRRDAALAINTPVYDAAPQDYDNAWTQALALHQGEWPQRALPALATVQSIKPDAADTLALAKAVRLPLFSWVGMPLSTYSDSDDIDVHGVGVDANIRLSDRWRLLGDVARRRYSATLGGPFAPLQGGDTVDEDRVGAGAHVSPSADVGIEFWAGTSRLDYQGAGSDTATIGRLSLSQRASDAFSYVLTADRDRVDASPRALAVMRNGVAADVRWTPGLRDTLSARGVVQHFDDGNQRQQLLTDYRHAVWRGGTVLVDVGGQLEWQHNSRDTGNGYYSPDRYERIAPLVSAYFAFNQDAGLYLSAALGAQRDESFDSWKRAADLNAELTLGIFSHWQLVGRAGYSQRLNQLGRYEGTTVGLEVRYRFCEFRADRCPEVH
jgi:tetratricopeptide (TPR) repeat protein